MTTMLPDRAPASGGGLLAFGSAAIEIYEACVRASEDLQRIAARLARPAPAREALTRSADLTRDAGATTASWSRWLLGL